MKNLPRLTVAFAFVVTLGAQVTATRQATATIAGKWDVVNPNRPAINSLDITADGKAVRGTWGGDTVRGEIAGVNLTFATPDTWLEWTDHSLGSDDMKASAATVSFATLKEDGTLSGRTDVFLRGYGQQAIKQWKWTATRVPGLAHNKTRAPKVIPVDVDAACYTAGFLKTARLNSTLAAALGSGIGAVILQTFFVGWN